MTYEPPKHFAVQNQSTLVSDRDVAYWTEGCRIQLRDHVCPVWALAVPGAAVYPVGTQFPEGTALAALIVDDIGDPGTLGEHGTIGGVPFVLIDAHLSEKPSVVLSHEFVETTVNVDLGEWVGPIIRNGRTYYYPREACDPVEGSDYNIQTVGLDGIWGVRVSNFVYPDWFKPDAPPNARLAYLDDLDAPFEIEEGGYAAPEIDGRVTFIGEGEMHMSARKFMPWGRAARLLRGRRAR